jgi:hypothetical protein
MKEIEAEFVKNFIVREKRERWLYLLGGTKGRRKILDALNHSLDVDRKLAKEISGEEEIRLKDILLKKSITGKCHVIADTSRLDGKTIDISAGVEAIILAEFGMVLVFEGAKTALYKPEAPATIMLLSTNA